MVQNSVNLFPAQNAWKAVFGLGAKDFEQMPISSNDMLIKKFDAGITDSHRARSPFVHILSVEEIIPEFILGYFSGLFSIEFDEHPNSASIHFLRTFAFAVQLQRLDGFAVPFGLKGFCHDASPLRFGVIKNGFRLGEVSHISTG